MKLSLTHYFFLFVASLFLGITCVELFSDGMFIDGLLYANISRNLAEGSGSFWKPHLTYTLYNEFYEHPPLAFGLQSIFFKIFGDNIYVERFYSLFTYVIVGYLIVLIWGKLTKERKTGWIPLFLWVITGDIAWAAANNLLENTMSIFICLSLLFYLTALEKGRILWVVLAGISLFMALLTKGVFCLYLWTLPFFVWLFTRKRTFRQMIADSLMMIAFTVLPVVLLYMLIPDAKNNMLQYFTHQVIGSIQNVQTVDSRFAIMGWFFQSIIFPVIVALIVIIFAFKMKLNKSLFRKNIRESLVFFAIVLSGVVPIMISMKQRSFYIITVYPLFAVGLGYYLYPVIKAIANNLKVRPIGHKIFKGITWGLAILSVVLSVNQINRIGRDKNMITDCKTIIEIVGKNTTIGICPELYSVWYLHGYMSRYGNVSLDANLNHNHLYFLTSEDCKSRSLAGYDLIPIKTKIYRLYKRKQ